LGGGLLKYCRHEEKREKKMEWARGIGSIYTCVGGPCVFAFFPAGVHPRLHFGGANASFLVGSWAENPLFGGMYVLPGMTAKISHGQNDLGAFLS